LLSDYISLPQKPGVYIFKNKKGEILYVGKAKSLKNRVSSYFANPSLLTGKTSVMVSQVATISIIPVESELESLLLEANLIKKFMPKYNIRLTDGKAYPLIRITYKNEFPAVITARRPDDNNSLYFGPYPHARQMHMVLRTIRRIFPFQSVLSHPNKICLYHHLGLCPCLPVFPENKKEYTRTLAHIIDFLEGKTKKLRADLRKERDRETKAEEFEKAAKLQSTLDAIAVITHPFHHPFEYETNPNFRSDIRMQEMQDLQHALEEHGVSIEVPVRIECFDNSNIQGTSPVASMVVLTEGEIDTSQYRKFKIKTVVGADDFASMKEVFQRRLKHMEWPLPQLFIVDGGKGQVSAAKEILKQEKITIPLIGLAKREETIITSDFEEIHLSKTRPALQLVMRIRDEAHRFAIVFHKRLRSKRFISSKR